MTVRVLWSAEQLCNFATASQFKVVEKGTNSWITSRASSSTCRVLGWFANAYHCSGDRRLLLQKPLLCRRWVWQSGNDLVCDQCERIEPSVSCRQTSLSCESHVAGKKMAGATKCNNKISNKMAFGRGDLALIQFCRQEHREHHRLVEFVPPLLPQPPQPSSQQPLSFLCSLLPLTHVTPARYSRYTTCT